MTLELASQTPFTVTLRASPGGLQPHARDRPAPGALRTPASWCPASNHCPAEASTKSAYANHSSAAPERFDVLHRFFFRCDPRPLQGRGSHRVVLHAPRLAEPCAPAGDERW